jgi:acyl-CoA hydrolase
MENYKLVLPEHLNQYGHLFGGYMLQWVDEYAWIAASLHYPGCTFVTIGLDKVEFKRGVRQGAILRFVVEKTKIGSTSVQYLVNVYLASRRQKEESVFSTKVTLVRIDEDGNKMALPE